MTSSAGRLSPGALILPLLVAFLPAQGAERITVEWIYGGGPQALAALPDTAWLADGTLLINDPESAGWSRLDPATGERAPALDRARALRSLARILGRTPRALPWPRSLDPAGRSAVYEILGDVMVLDLDTSTFARVTSTGAREKSARLSPDGDRVAFIRGSDLYVHDLARERTRRLTSDGSHVILNGTLPWVYWEEVFGRQDSGYWWSPDSRRIAFLRSDESMVTEVVHLDFKPQVPRIIRQRYPKAGTTNPVVRVGVADVETGGITWVRLGDNTAEYIVRVKWLPDGDRLSVQTLDRDQRVLHLWFVDVATGKGKRILTEKDEAWVNLHDDLYVLADGRHFLWVSERDGYSHLYRYTLEGKMAGRITKGPWTLLASSPVFWMRQAVQAIDEKRGHVFFGALKDSPLETHIYRVNLDGTGLQRITREPGTHTVRFSPDGRHYLDEHSRISRPPSLGLYKADGTLVKTLVAARTGEADKLGLIYPELFHIPARDGFPMPAYLYKPRGFDPERRYPLIMYTYGGPSSRSVTDAWQHSSLFFDQILLRKGYLVACVDNRSATGISKRLENTVVGQMTSDGELNDLLDAVRWFKGQPWVDGNRVGIWGWSNGGMMTLLAMTRSREFKAGISVAPVTRWEYYDTIWCEQVNKRPQDNPDGFRHTDLTARAHDLHGRLLLVHATYDDNVHIQNTWHFVDELIKANKMFDLMIYPMRKHSIADRPARVHLFNTMLEFWERHL